MYRKSMTNNIVTNHQQETRFVGKVFFLSKNFLVITNATLLLDKKFLYIFCVFFVKNLNQTSTRFPNSQNFDAPNLIP